MVQTKGLLSNTEGLAKNQWHKCSVYRVSMVSAFLLKEHVGAWEWKKVEWIFGISTGLEIGRVEAVGDKGRGSRVCGKRVLVLTNLVFQAVWGAREARIAAGRLWSPASKSRASVFLVSSHTRT